MRLNAGSALAAAVRVWLCCLALAACSSPEAVRTDIAKVNQAPLCCRDLQQLGQGGRAALAGNGRLSESSPHFEFPSGRSPFVLADVPAGDGPRVLEVRQSAGDAVMIDGVPQLKFLPISVWFLDGSNRKIETPQKDLFLKQYSALSGRRLVRSVPIPPEAQAAILFDDGALLNRTVAIPVETPELYLALPKATAILPGGTAMVRTIMVPYGTFEAVLLGSGAPASGDSR